MLIFKVVMVVIQSQGLILKFEVIIVVDLFEVKV
jgi:hypothetical protein